jgi:hypothetical protein
MPSGGALQMGSTPNEQTWIVTPATFTTAMAAIGAGKSTLLLRAGDYQGQTIITSAGSNITLAAYQGAGRAVVGAAPQITFGWSPGAGSALTLRGLYIAGSGTSGVAQLTSAAASLIIQDCYGDTIDARLGGMVTLDNSNVKDARASSVESRNGSVIRSQLMGGTTTRMDLTQLQSPAGTVHTSVGTLAMDQYSLDFFGSSRSKLGGSGPMRALEGMQFGGVLPDANATISAPTGVVWFIPGTNSADRTYTLGQVGVSDGASVMVENRDSSGNAKIIYAATGVPSGTIATMPANMGQVFKHTASVGWNAGARYQL